MVIFYIYHSFSLLAGIFLLKKSIVWAPVRRTRALDIGVLSLSLTLDAEITYINKHIKKEKEHCFPFFFQGAHVPSSGEWYLETKKWVYTYSLLQGIIASRSFL